MQSKKKSKKTVYYSDEHGDDFAKFDIEAKKIEKDFKYEHKNPIWNFFAFIAYYLIAFPLVWFFERVLLRIRFVNKKSSRKVGHCFFYGNHIGFIDAFTPNLISFPRRNMIVVGPETVSIKGLKTVVQWLGALPVPSDISTLIRFKHALLKNEEKKHNITIYPEAHIWPYFTGVRDFPDTSFAYPVETNTPVIAFFTAFSEPRGFLSCFRKANITVFVSDPIYPDASLSKRDARRDLRDRVYAFMKVHSEKYSTYAAVEYIKSDKGDTVS